MGKLPSLTARKVEQILLKAGFVVDKTKSAHKTYFHPTSKHFTTLSSKKEASNRFRILIFKVPFGFVQGKPLWL